VQHVPCSHVPRNARTACCACPPRSYGASSSIRLAGKEAAAAALAALAAAATDAGAVGEVMRSRGAPLLLQLLRCGGEASRTAALEALRTLCKDEGFRCRMDSCAPQV
jgi:hypothetical protein